MSAGVSLVDRDGSHAPEGILLQRALPAYEYRVQCGETDHELVARLHGIVAMQDADGTWQLDAEATTACRAELRRARLSESSPAEAWWHEERARVLDHDVIPEVAEMYRQSMSFAKFDDEFRRFWQLPDAFAFAEA